MKNLANESIDLETTVFVGVVGRMAIGHVPDFKAKLAALGFDIVFVKLSTEPLWIIRKEE